MKFQVTMKDPDSLQDAIEEAAKKITVEGLDGDELDAVRESRMKKMSELCQRWFEYGEYLVVEVDTEAETCRVVPN